MDDGVDALKKISVLEYENKKLKEQFNKLKEKTVEHLGMAETLHDAVVKENNEKYEEVTSLKEQNDYLKVQLEELEENYFLHKKAADIYEKKLIEEIDILRKRPVDV